MLNRKTEYKQQNHLQMLFSNKTIANQALKFLHRSDQVEYNERFLRVVKNS